ncbi:MAG: hypothetical protein ACK55Z_03015, partial [bacterium]
LLNRLGQQRPSMLLVHKASGKLHSQNRAEPQPPIRRRADVHCTADCPGDAPKGHACAGVDQQRVGDGLCR